MIDENVSIGNMVVFNGGVSKHQISWGGHTDPDGLLSVGSKYEIEKIEVHSWHTRVYLVGFPKMFFNSVWFSEI